MTERARDGDTQVIQGELEVRLLLSRAEVISDKKGGTDV